MGYLLKEVLKTLCGVNQWSYAVFWKIGCQNTKLLIWEESYYETPTISGDWSEVQNFQLLNRLHLLVNKTMMENQFTLVGEGLIGRAAVTGNHQWILSKGLSGDAHPPEVLKELSQQFLAGIQTISVIPVLPHGVVQFGSYLHIMENMGFVEGVRMLISQLGCVPGVLLSDENATKEPALNAAASVYYDVYPHNSQLPNNMIKAEVIPPNPPNLWTKQQASLHVPKPPFSHESSIGSIMLDNGLIEQQVSGENNLVKANLDVFRESHPKADHVLMSNSHENTVFPPTGGTELIASSELRESSSINVVNHKQSLDGEGAGFFLDGNKGMVENDLFQALSIMLTQNEQQPSSSEYISDVYEVQYPAVGDAKYEGVYAQHEPEDDLMDVLGADLKNRLLNGSSSLNNELSSGPTIKNMSASTISNSDSDMFSMSGFDRILDNMVSNRCSKQSQEDNVSCRTTLTNLSGSSAANCSSSYSRAGVSGQIQSELFGPLSKSGAVSSCSFKSECSKESAGIYSRGSSIYGSSQISSWVESGYDTKPSSSVSTGYSKKPDETTKTGRKRLKSGENPRPRPKDRQMIQDRVKELREIVPNGAKCSIDALLERTIKHMLFLQSVTKHADKLKQTGESKIISKEGGLLLKDNIEGGATWAYEVGSQSMVCPIIVEDLNHPRQMLVEMLCEERGLFLEIADIIRGLGLTILKGVMETRNDKIWARFAVEANRDVTRMEIFISLVRLLEQTAKGGNDPANADTAMAHSFHQAATIPATGRPCSLL